ncbi:MAG: hypothetical protein NC033_03235 [Clostridiales bacterium]|nr:hypothetical protein [Clostridiales bacterium]
MGDNKNAKGMTKADVILTRIEQLTKQVASLETRVARGLQGKGGAKSGAEPASDAAVGAVIRKLTEENATLKKEISYVSAQIEGLYTSLSKLINKLPEKLGAKNGDLVSDVDDLASRVAAKIIIPEADFSGFEGGGTTVSGEGLDYEALGYAVAKRLYVPQAITEEIDYDKLAEKLTGKMPPVEIDYAELGYSVAKKMYIPQAIAEDVDYDAIANKVLEKMPAYSAVADETAYASAEPVSVQAEIDYDLLASKVAEAVAVQEPVSPDYIAARVAEQIVVPQTMQAEAVDLDVEELSRKVADKIALPAYEPAENVDEERLAEAIAERLKESEEIEEATPASFEATLDEESLAENIASRLNFSLSDELIAAAVVKNLSDAIDSDEIADCVAKRVGTISPEQFEITVDDDGCDSLAKAVESRLDYDSLAAAVAEKLNPAFMAADVTGEIDTDELARALSDKLSVNADINEDVLADKAAAILSNYMPEVDSADIADKVIAGVIPALPSTPVIDGDGIANTVTERLLEYQENSDYEIVIDDEGLSRISDGVTEEISKDEEERRAKLNEELDGIKEEYGKRFDKIDEDIEEIKRMLLSGIVVAGTTETATTEVVEEVQPEEELVTVSDLLIEEEPVEELVEEVTEEVVEEERDEVIEEIVEDIDENLSDEEIMPDGIEGIDGLNGGVDFANMMKYNRSFIARIIQGSDEQKNYYGQVKTALLSYKKVNSNVAWGAERFNKGRETIARFKIRGKTLCLYLALDPNDYETSVYHHADVSDNKSMHGTPMMVKIKSPRGVKKAIRLIDEMLAKRNGEKHNVAERDYAAMYPYETIEELIEDGLVKDVNK